MEASQTGSHLHLGPVGILGNEDDGWGYASVAPGNVILDNTGTVGGPLPNQGSAPAMEFVSVEVTIPTGGLPFVRLTLSYNQYNGTSNAQVWFARNGGFLGFRTLLPHQIVDENGDPTGLSAASGGTLSLIDTNVPAGATTYSLWLWAFSEGHAELLTDPSTYPTYLLVEGI